MSDHESARNAAFDSDFWSSNNVIHNKPQLRRPAVQVCWDKAAVKNCLSYLAETFSNCLLGPDRDEPECNY
jgi:hypothetical protein